MVNHLNEYRRISTERYHGHGVSFCPHLNDYLAVAGAENFGIKGSGSLLICKISAPNPHQYIFRYQDAIFDLSWSKYNPSVIVTGSGDGCIQFWVISKPSQVPVSCNKLHHKEVSSVEFVASDFDYFSSSSWDSTIILSVPNSSTPAAILQNEDNAIVYEARWSPVRNRALASVSGSGTMIIWSPFTSNQPNLVLGNIGAEILTCDWSYADQNLLVTGCTGATVLLWDLRAPRMPVVEMRGHENAIRKVRFNPVVTDEVASVSYDFTTRLWSTASGQEISSTQAHKEFVYGLDFSILNPGIVADCSWDRTVQIYKLGPHQDRISHIHSSPAERQIGIDERLLPPVPLSYESSNPVGPSHTHLPNMHSLPEYSNVPNIRPLPPLPEN